MRRIAPAPRARGTVRVGSDKSISHRALLFSTIAEGEAEVSNLLGSEDVASTRRACVALGADWKGDSHGSWRVRGLGLGGLRSPSGPIDAGNSGTTARLLLGLLAGAGIDAEITGDASLSRRPMERVAAPLREMGARVTTTEGHLPARVRSGATLRPGRFALEVASAQIASSILLAGLFLDGETEVMLPAPARDHTARMLRYLGARVRVDGLSTSVRGGARLTARPIRVPGDPSSAAFFAVLAACGGGEVRIPNLLANPTRTGAIEVLAEMGAEIRWEDRTSDGPEAAGGFEEVGTLVVRGGRPLRGVRVAAERAGTLIDEIPILSVAAHFATGETLFEGVGELRVKETDRLCAIVEEFGRVGVVARVQGETLVVVGSGGEAPKGGSAAARDDHRIAMSLAVLGRLSLTGVEIGGDECVAISYPRFFEDLSGV